MSNRRESAGARAPWHWPAALALAAGSGLSLLAAFSPPGGASLGPIALVALVPFAAMIDRSSPRRCALLGGAAGLILSGGGVFWLAQVTVIGWALLALYISGYIALAALGVRLLRRRLPMGLALPMAWCAAELVRARLFGGFPWLLLGHTQHTWTTLIQIADVAGVYGVSFVAAAVNGLIFDAWRAAQAAGSWRGALRCAGTLAALLALVTGYGLWRVQQAQFRPGPKIALIQANIPQDAKNDPSLDARKESFQRHMQLSFQAAGGTGQEPPALIIWPETMITSVLLDPAAAWPAEMRRDLTQLARRRDVRLLIGANHVSPEERKLYNSAIYIGRPGADAPLGRYDKLHLVPFGEYVPVKSLLGFLAPVIPYEVGFSPGGEPVVFDLNGVKFGVLICFEDVFPELAAMYFEDGRQVDLLVNLTNDGWFGDSAELEQHQAAARFRAIEFRVPLIRAANTGVSGFIDPLGRVQSVVESRGHRRNVAGWLADRPRLLGRPTLYRLWGDLPAWLNFAAVLALILAPCVNRALPAKNPATA